MKKFLALIFSSALILGACGNDDTSNKDSDTKSENKTEKKSEDKKDNKSKEDKKSKEEKKSQENEDNKSKQEDNSTEEQHTQETATNEQAQAQSQQQTQETTTQEQQQTQQADNNQQQYSDEYLANNPVSTDGDWTPEMIEENERLNEEMKANAKVAKENGYTGIPNGDVGGVPTPDEYYSNDQLDPDTGLPMEDADQHDVE
ncbi:hypothetical protein BUZ50_06035 [Staphylococcus hominis]|uniref:hypothetical protein n=1 Tax=Staphylococcus hominis TaxID=1290 RepID=UPI000E67A83F|nr:hypothetical protein [Staphylococcus hominis]RIO55599.1 hypothetical protein BUZ50_06035 [Staphylococcus hominis]